MSGLCAFRQCPYEASYFCSRGQHWVCARHIPDLLDNRCSHCKQLDGSNRDVPEPWTWERVEEEGAVPVMTLRGPDVLCRYWDINGMGTKDAATIGAAQDLKKALEGMLSAYEGMHMKAEAHLQMINQMGKIPESGLVAKARAVLAKVNEDAKDKEADSA